jgi:hypothetical protein
MKKLTIEDVRLSPDGTRLFAAPVRYLFPRHGEGVPPKADWSAVEQHVRRARKALGLTDKHPWRAKADAWVHYSPRKCDTCGKSFCDLERSQWYCSTRCKPKRKSEAKEPQPKRCEHCGTTFTPARQDARTCSVRCRVALYRKPA